jgi:putative phage-type endonuclease
MMDGSELIQRSPEWFAARCGSLGASSLHEVIARTKSGYSASRANRLAALVVERLTGKPTETYQNAAMLQGIEMEPEARAAYAFYSDADVQEVGLIRHPTIAWSHASPDGLIGADGMVELKAPQPAAHLAVLMDGKIPEKYVTQCHWQLACCPERKWNDFASYNASFPEHLRLWVRRIERDDARIAELEKEVRVFLAELEEVLGKLTRLAA